MTPTPEGWTPTTLGQLGRYLNGRGFKKSEWAASGRPIIRIQNLTGSGSGFNFFAGEPDERYIARSGDLLVSWAATLGAFIWSGPEAVVNQHIFKVESNINVRFHKYLLDYKLEELMRQTHGSGIVHITRSKFDDLPVAIPSLSEQRRIVDLLEDHLSRLDAAARLLDSVAARLRALRATQLEELKRNASSAWGTTSLEAVAVEARYGTSEKCVMDGAGVPVVRIPNLADGAVDMSDEKRVENPNVDTSGLMLMPGDLLIVRTNGSRDLIGRSAVVQPGVNAAFASYLIRYRLNLGLVDPAWVRMMFEAPSTRVELEALAASSAGQYNLGLKKLDTIRLPVPPLASQVELLHASTVLIGASAHLTPWLATGQRRLNSLRRSLLTAAFSGELTEGRSASELTHA